MCRSRFSLTVQLLHAVFFQVIKMEIKTIKWRADIHTPSFPVCSEVTGEPLTHTTKGDGQHFFFFIKDSHGGNYSDKVMDYTRFVLRGGSISRKKNNIKNPLTRS